MTCLDCGQSATTTLCRACTTLAKRLGYTPDQRINLLTQEALL